MRYLSVFLFSCFATSTFAQPCDYAGLGACMTALGEVELCSEKAQWFGCHTDNGCTVADVGGSCADLLGTVQQCSLQTAFAEVCPSAPSTTCDFAGITACMTALGEVEGCSQTALYFGCYTDNGCTVADGGTPCHEVAPSALSCSLQTVFAEVCPDTPLDGICNAAAATECVESNPHRVDGDCTGSGESYCNCLHFHGTCLQSTNCMHLLTDDPTLCDWFPTAANSCPDGETKNALVEFSNVQCAANPGPGSHDPVSACLAVVTTSLPHCETLLNQEPDQWDPSACHLVTECYNPFFTCLRDANADFGDEKLPCHVDKCYNECGATLDTFGIAWSTVGGPSPCWSHNSHCYLRDNVIQNIAQSNLMECLGACDRSKKCKTIDFREDGSRCLLQDKTQWSASKDWRCDKKVSDRHTYSKDTCELVGNTCFKKVDGCVLYGGILRTEDVGGYDECVVACESDPNCLAVTLEKSSSKCALHSTSSETAPDKLSCGHSDYVYAEERACRDTMDCMEAVSGCGMIENTKDRKSTIKLATYSNIDAVKCQQRCAENSKCKAATYNEAWQTCYLHPMDRHSGYRKWKCGKPYLHYFGKTMCQSKNGFCYHGHMKCKLDGHTIKTEPTDTVVHCTELCWATPGCWAVEFHTNPMGRRECALKSANKAQVPEDFQCRQRYPVHYVEPTPCLPKGCPVGATGCTLSGNDLGVISQDMFNGVAGIIRDTTLYDCLRICTNHDECKSATFRSKTCMLKTETRDTAPGDHECGLGRENHYLEPKACTTD